MAERGMGKWVVGLAVGAVLTVTGWGTAAVLASKNAEFWRICEDVSGLKTYAVSNDKRITRLEAQYESILGGIVEIKQAIKEINAR